MQTRPALHIPSLLYLILSASGVVISLTSASVLFLSGVLARIRGESNVWCSPTWPWPGSWYW